MDKWNELKQKVKELNASNISVGFTTGTFDILHTDHIAHLLECKEYCDFLIVKINSDQNVKGRKGGNRPIICDLDRLRIVKSIRYVDFALIYDFKSSNALYNSIADLGVNYYFPGVKTSTALPAEHELILTSHGIKVVWSIRPVQLISTTEIISEIVKKYKNG